jgi:hypothetical protein
MGVGGLVSFGLLTKLVIDQSPDLKKIILFKTALARDFAERGISEIQLRKEQRQVYRLSLASDRSMSEEELVRFDGELAEYFLKNFPEKSAQILRISYLSAGSGCRAATERRAKEVSLNALRRGLLQPSQRAHLEERLRADLSCRLVSLERHGPAVEAAVESPPGFNGDARQLASRVEGLVREELRSAPYETLSLRLWAAGEQGPSPGATAPPPEVRFDSRGKELRR